MSKEILDEVRWRRRQAGHGRAWIFAVFFALLAVLVAPVCFTGKAQPAPQQTVTTSAAARNATLIAATEEVLKETSDLRQLSVLRPVQSSMQSRAEIERAIIRNLDAETSAADLHASEVTLKKLGLAAPNFNYRDLMVRVLTEQVAGYYEPKTRQFHLADWIDIDGQKPIMAHELTHALQDQHFNLLRFEHWPKGDSDAELAAHALIEGDATLAMVLYVTNNPLRALAFLKSMGANGLASDELQKAPRALRESLLFPYEEGLNWTRALYKEGGWNEVSQAFKALPASTEQVLHPDKYFAHEAPVKVTLPDVARLLNAAERGRGSGNRGQRTTNEALSKSPLAGSPSPTPASAWRRLASDVNGEWGFYLILDQFLKSAAESRKAAAGWAGDRYDVYEGPTGEVLYISLSAWDSETEAREFFDAYLRRLALRYPSPTKMIGNDETGAATTFETPEGAVAMELHGARVLIVEGIPDSVSLGSILKALRATS